jgi:hypothetical protein
MSQITLDTNPEEGMTAKSRKGKMHHLSYDTPNSSTVEAIDTRTKEEKEAAEKNAKDGKRVGNYIRQTRYSSPIRTKKGGKSRKQRGSRKNKQSRRR